MGHTVAVDFDGVISQYRDWKGLGVFGPVIDGCKDELQKLRNEGWTIIVFTTRGEDIDQVAAYLRDNHVPYDFINKNAPGAPENISDKKVLADVYLDDRAVRFCGNWIGVADRVKNITPHWCREVTGNTLADADLVMEQDMARLAEANSERRDAWRNVGLAGLFLDLRKQYLRTRSFLWERIINGDRVACDPENAQHERWRQKSIDILRDLRNYALFMQLLLLRREYDTPSDSNVWSERIADRFDEDDLRELKSNGYKNKQPSQLPEDL